MADWERTARERLEAAGWLMEVAGREDFGRVARAFAAARGAVPVRGVLLCGAFGCGKSSALRALYRAGRTDCTLWLSCVYAEEWDGTDLTVNREWPANLPGGTVVLDDMGAEPPPRFGRDIVGDYIVRRHARWEAGRAGALAVTTNLTGAGLAERYGGRVMSRLLEMTVPAALAGGDKRRRIAL